MSNTFEGPADVRSRTDPTPTEPADPTDPAGAPPPVPLCRLERLLYAAVVAGVVLAGWARRWTSDDAFINYRVVENILAGHGPVFSAGERTEVATSPAWLLLLTVGEWLVPGDDVAWISVVLGILGTATGVCVAMLGARRLYRGTPARTTVPFGALVLLALPPMWDFTTSGLETGLSFAWLALCFWGIVRWMPGPVAGRPLWLYAVLGLGPLVRPDFALISAILLLWMTVVATGTWRRRLLGLVAAGVLPLAYQVFRMGFYGLLVPNTAVAKESSRPLWDRGFAYLLDLVGPHLLWIPGLLALAVVVVVLPSVTWGRREWSFVGVVVLAAVGHALYVVRVGGDFMHARLLMPCLFLILCPVSVVPFGRARAWAAGALLAATGGWAIASAAVLRPFYPNGISDDGIADERDFYERLAGVDDPITLDDHGGVGISHYVATVNELQADGEDLVVVQVIPVEPDTGISVLAPSSGGMVLSVGNAGFYGYAADLDVFVVDGLGLTDPVNSHLEPGPPVRAGHEKVYPSWYLLARFGSPELAEGQGEGMPAVDEIAAARAALSCGDLAELLEATSGPMSWDRFWDNVVGAPGRTSLRIPADPFAAEQQFC